MSAAKLASRYRLFLPVLAGLLLLLGAIAFGKWAAADAPGRIELNSTTYNFGTIPNTAPVSHDFTVTNAGQGPLQILGVSTSCGCTSAEVAETTLAPGATTTLTVTYDPLAHDGAPGQFERMVFVRTDDREQPEVRLSLRVTVVEG